jgi:lipoate-protein ligase A
MPANDPDPYPIPSLGPMRRLDLTLPGVAANLALDEALLQEVEEEGLPPVVRLWELPEPAVVLGASSRLHEDVDVAACRADGVPIARRSSGGGTVLIGPGTLNATVVLPLDAAPSLAAVDVAQRSVLECLARALRAQGLPVRVLGSGDLTMDDRKVAGSAQRRLRRHFLIHTTILYNLDLGRIDRYLALPRRQPEYRRNRSHGEFVRNLPIARATLRDVVQAGWLAPGSPPRPAAVPERRVDALMANRFADPAWVERF